MVTCLQTWVHLHEACTYKRQVPYKREGHVVVWTKLVQSTRLDCLSTHGNFAATTVAHTDSTSDTWNVTKCYACHAKRHEHIFWHVHKDTRKSRLCDFSHRHGNFAATTVAHTDSASDTWNVTKCYACHAKRHEHIFWHVHKDTRKSRLRDFSHRHSNFAATMVAHTDSSSDTWNVTKCHACHAKRHDHSFWHVHRDTRKSRLCDFSHRHGNFAATTAAGEHAQTVANGFERSRTVANGCGRLRTQKAGSREQGSTPRPPNVKREPFATHSGKNNFDLLQTKHFNRLFCAQPVCVYILYYIYI